MSFSSSYVRLLVKVLDPATLLRRISRRWHSSPRCFLRCSDLTRPRNALPGSLSAPVCAARLRFTADRRNRAKGRATGVGVDGGGTGRCFIFLDASAVPTDSINLVSSARASFSSLRTTRHEIDSETRARVPGRRRGRFRRFFSLSVGEQTRLAKRNGRHGRVHERRRSRGPRKSYVRFD